MRFSEAVIVFVFAVGAVASPAQNYVVHEKRHERNAAWTRVSRLDESIVLPVKIGLAQQNLDKGHDWLMEVSDPSSNKFGQHWSLEQVKNAFKPSDDTINSVKGWLTDSGISHNRQSLSAGMNWLHFNATVKELESLFRTTYHYFEHEETGTPSIACDNYSVPAHLRKHIDLITPTVHFDAKIKHQPVTAEASRRKRALNSDAAKNIGSVSGNIAAPKSSGWLNIKNPLISQLQACNQFMTPACLRALYQFLPNFMSNPRNSFGVVEYTPQAYLPADLDLFFQNFSSKLVGQRPILASIDGGILQQSIQSFDANAESDLDLQYTMSLVYPQKVTLYQVGDLVEGASFNNFLDAFDASYCPGDDSTKDGKYPDPYNKTGAYTGPEACGSMAPAKVISTSYGYNEADLTPAYETRQCQEYQKLGLLGTSFFYSSGDFGVAGNGGQCLDPSGDDYNSGASGKFNPAFPATCPYVTVVGATQLIANASVVRPAASHTQPEMACETIISSGGGFSNIFPIPSYQAAAVQSWFTNYPPPYGSDRFNNSRATRAYPDISANGANFVAAVDGTFALVYGTSASTPVVASIFALVNEARMDVGKGSVGFVNPALYAHPAVLNDVVLGGNLGCGTAGFQAVPGWDPVTGLGTPSFPRLLALYLSLP